MEHPDPDTLERLRSLHLIEPEELAERLGDPSLRIVDLRGEVATRTGSDGVQSAEYRGREDRFLEGHIPGAVYLDWTRDIVDEDDPVPAQAAPPEKLARVLGSLGIGSDHELVAYDDHPASQFATRFWWLLRLYGHPRCRVLNGGWKTWTARSLPVATAPVIHPAAAFRPLPCPQWRRTAEEVAAAIGRQDTHIVDARDEGQYSGRVRRGPRGGHIPGAVHLPREALTTPEGSFRSPMLLRECAEAAGLLPNREVVAYCNGGVAATSVLFALSMLGFPRLANYDGSWNEWSRRFDLPVEAGPPPAPSR